MLDYGRKLKKRKHEIDSTDVASVEASTHVFLEDETIMMSGRRCYHLNTLICPRLHPTKSDLLAETSFCRHQVHSGVRSWLIKPICEVKFCKTADE